MGGTCGTLSAGAAAVRFFDARPVTLRVGAFAVLVPVACCAELEPLAFEPSGGIEAFEEDGRR